MPKLVPSINAQDFEELKNKVNLIKEAAEWLHLDVSSRDFTNYESWHNPIDLDRLEKDDLKFEVHLMEIIDSFSINRWFKGGVKRIIFHIEATHEPDKIIKAIKKGKREIGIALEPETPADALEPYLDFINMVLVLGVSPGPSGQKMDSAIFKKIKFLKNKTSRLKLEIDGGVNEENLKELVEAGFDYIVSGHEVFSVKKPVEELKKMQKLINSYEKS